MATDRFDRSVLVDQAIELAGEDDFGESTWEEGLDVLLDSLVNEARLNDIGVEIAVGDVNGYLGNRLAINAWRRDHPEVADGTIEKPLVIVGQPRTGTTILHDLLAQDPLLRAPLTWEVDRPVPAPETATYETDARIGEVQANLDMVDLVLPGFRDFHPMGAQLAQECVRITAGDFRSMIFPTQYRVPSYNRWLLDQADLASAYRWHRRFLQHLQSGHPAGQWLLKSPAHLWSLDALAAEYPDAIVVQTHRDPLKVVASVSALVTHLRGMASDETSIEEVAADYADDIFLGLDRGMDARDRNVLPSEQIVDVHFETFVADPLDMIGDLYDRLGRELTPDTEARMRAFITEHPGDGGGGGTRYRWADTGLDADKLRERAAPYQERFGVSSEPVR
jgi:hypothetical protein